MQNPETWIGSMIAASHLSRSFDGRAAVVDLTFEIRRGEIFTLLGPNGAGKTTTMRLLAGLIPPTSGRVMVDGVPMDGSTGGALRRRIGLLTEFPGLWERLTVEQNLSVYSRLHQLRQGGDVVLRMLDRVGLVGRRHDMAGTLSKGMKQKLALGRALLHDPDILLLDEPTAGLDPEFARSVRELIRALRDEGRAILLSTHNLDEADRLADRVAVLRSCLVALDTPEALRRRFLAPSVRVRLGEPAERFAEIARTAGAREIRADGNDLVARVSAPDQDVPAIVRALAAAGAPIREVIDEQAPLEEIYLALTRSVPEVSRVIDS
jgi:ABC-2 type transport system ATP-binding protein